jgi:hypothetical protein
MTTGALETAAGTVAGVAGVAGAAGGLVIDGLRQVGGAIQGYLQPLTGGIAAAYEIYKKQGQKRTR